MVAVVFGKVFNAYNRPDNKQILVNINRHLEKWIAQWQ